MRGLFPSQNIVKFLAKFVEWYFYTSSPIQTEETLRDQDALLSELNKLKVPFAEVSPSSLNFPKFHSLQHYSEWTRMFGTPDNFDTEITEHQHRIEVKLPYQRTNKREPTSQIVKFVERRTALDNKLELTNKKIVNNEEPTVSTNFRHLGSRIPEGPLNIIEASKMFNIPNLERDIRIFFNDEKDQDSVQLTNSTVSLSN